MPKNIDKKNYKYNKLKAILKNKQYRINLLEYYETLLAASQTLNSLYSIN